MHLSRIGTTYARRTHGHALNLGDHKTRESVTLSVGSADNKTPPTNMVHSKEQRTDISKVKPYEKCSQKPQYGSQLSRKTLVDQNWYIGSSRSIACSMSLSALETMASCNVSLAARCIGGLGSSGSQCEHWTYRFGHTSPLAQAGLGLFSLQLTVGSSLPDSTASGARRRRASPQVICEHLSDLLGVQAQKTFIQGRANSFPGLLDCKMLRLKFVDLFGEDAHCCRDVHVLFFHETLREPGLVRRRLVSTMEVTSQSCGGPKLLAPTEIIHDS